MVPQLVHGNSKYKDTVIFWLTLSLILVSVSFIAVLGFLVASRIKRTPGDHHELHDVEKSTNSYAELKPSKKKRRSLQSIANRIEEEELQREYMIRKSYASRTSRADTQCSRRSDETFSHEMGQPATNMNNESKAGSRNQQRERSLTNERRPTLAITTDVANYKAPVVAPAPAPAPAPVQTITVTEEPSLVPYPLFVGTPKSGMAQPKVLELEAITASPMRYKSSSMSGRYS